MNLIVSTITELETFLSPKAINWPQFDLDICSKAKYEHICNSLGGYLDMTSYTLSILFFSLKPIVKRSYCGWKCP
jgi:hypothetical protein